MNEACCPGSANERDSKMIRIIEVHPIMIYITLNRELKIRRKFLKDLIDIIRIFEIKIIEKLRIIHTKEASIKLGENKKSFLGAKKSRKYIIEIDRIVAIPNSYKRHLILSRAGTKITKLTSIMTRNTKCMK